MNTTLLNLIFQLAIILTLTSIIRPLSIKLKIPPVIGLMLLGIVLGPSVLHFAENNPTFNWIAETGVLILIFSAGVETNLQRLKQESKKAVFPALGGVIIPFLSGFFLSTLFGYTTITSLMVGTIFTATSISVSLMTLFEINKFNSVEGRCIVNSAIIDDIIGIVIISLIFSVSLGNSTSTLLLHKTLLLSILKIVIFFVVSYFIGRYVILNIYLNSNILKLEGSILPISVAVIFIYAWFAEMLGLAAIIGAYLSGLVIGQTEYKDEIYEGVTNLGRSFFIDMFFVTIGLGLNLKGLTFSPSYQILFVIFAMVSKFFGSGLGALISRFDFTRSLRIGVGMIPRGEVALIISSMAYHRKLIGDDILSTTIIMVIVTAISTPFLIKYSYTLTHKETFNL